MGKLRVYEFHYGADNPKTASVLNNLGFVTYEIGDAQMAAGLISTRACLASLREHTATAIR